jgi:hypothetical protein
MCVGGLNPSRPTYFYKFIGNHHDVYQFGVYYGMQEKEAVCKKHGLTRFVIYGGENGFRCTKCRQEAVSKYRKNTKIRTLEVYGGKCIICGYNRYHGALHFHHVNPELKEFGLSCKGITRSKEKVDAELKKCVLVCANCHAEIEAGITQIPVELLEGVVI